MTATNVHDVIQIQVSLVQNVLQMAVDAQNVEKRTIMLKNAPLELNITRSLLDHGRDQRKERRKDSLLDKCLVPQSPKQMRQNSCRSSRHKEYSSESSCDRTTSPKRTKRCDVCNRHRNFENTADQNRLGDGKQRM